MNAIAQECRTFRQPAWTPQGRARRPLVIVRRIRSTLRLWGRRVRERQALQQLSYRDMRDIGVTPADIAWEVSQPFWRAAPPR